VLPLTRAVIAVQNPKGMFSMVHAEIGGFKAILFGYFFRLAGLAKTATGYPELSLWPFDSSKGKSASKSIRE
jgi:hypothetical protein